MAAEPGAIRRVLVNLWDAAVPPESDLPHRNRRDVASIQVPLPGGIAGC